MSVGGAFPPNRHACNFKELEELASGEATAQVLHTVQSAVCPGKSRVLLLCRLPTGFRQDVGRDASHVQRRRADSALLVTSGLEGLTAEFTRRDRVGLI
jgi:hypothetical protein